MKTTSNNAKLILACSLAIIAILIVQGVLNATPPAQLQVTMYRLNSSGSIYQPGGTKYPCPDSQNSWGCTAFDSGQTLGHAVTIVSYPYGNTPEPMVSLETGYLKNVVPEEMSIDLAPSSALEAQVIAARSYGWNKSGDLNNSAQRQVYVPYRFEFLRVEGGDTAHNNRTEGSIAQRRKRLGRAASAWKRQHPEDWEWECFGQQNPAWLRYEKQVTVQ